MAGFVFALYIVADQSFDHYALGYTAPLVVFLVVQAFVFLYSAANLILLSRGYVDHRLTGTGLQLGMSLLFVYFVRPSTVWELVLSQAAAVVSTFIYYSWVCGRATDPIKLRVLSREIEPPQVGRCRGLVGATLSNPLA